MLTEQQAFEAMRYFLAEFWKRGGSKKGDDLFFVLGWTERTHCEGGSTNDPAQWHDWLAAVKAVQDGKLADPWGAQESGPGS
jgi:hypothetical protein